MGHLNPSESASLLPGPADIGPAEELGRVMSEIAGALGGVAAALTIHPAGEPARVVHLDGDAELERGLASLVASGALDYPQRYLDHHAWVPAPLDHYAAEALVLPVRRVPGHGRLMVTVFFRTAEAERRAAAEKAFLERRPFAVGFFRLWQQERLRRGELETARAALDRMGTAVALITRAGTLAFANDAARRLLAERDGVWEQNGRLRARDRAGTIALETAIDHAIYATDATLPPEAAPVLRLRRENRAPLVVAVLPASSPAAEEGEVAALVFAVDPDMDVRRLALPICRAFNLTRVETELACELASGLGMAEAAAKLRMKEATARSHLRTIFSKTGTNRQADLIRMILVSLVRVLDAEAGGPG